MAREINLNGGEITILKAIGLSGAPAFGRMLVEQIGEMETAEILDELNGLISLGYVVSDKVNLYSLEDIQKCTFRVNGSYARDLRDAIHPSRRRERDKPRRRRRA